MLKTTGIDHVNLTVRSLSETCKFWKDLLGFELLEDIPEQNGKIIGTENAILALYEDPNFKEYIKTGFNHLSFHIENFEDIESICKQLNLKIEYGGAVKWSKSRSIYVNDPNGYEIELAEVWGGGLVKRIQTTQTV